jgi:hypothetical protein
MEKLTLTRDDIALEFERIKAQHGDMSTIEAYSILIGELNQHLWGTVHMDWCRELDMPVLIELQREDMSAYYTELLAKLREMGHEITPRKINLEPPKSPMCWTKRKYH